MTYLIILGLGGFAFLLWWSWRKIPISQCPRCQSYNTADIDSPVGRQINCLDCDYEWGVFD